MQGEIRQPHEVSETQRPGGGGGGHLHASGQLACVLRLSLAHHAEERVDISTFHLNVGIAHCAKRLRMNMSLPPASIRAGLQL